MITPDFDALHIVGPDVIDQTLNDTKVLYAIDLGGGVTLHFGTREESPIWIVQNPAGQLGAVLHDVGA